MKRVVITGLGIKSSIGNSKEEVSASLREARSGIEHSSTYEELGFRSHVHGPIRLDLDSLIDRKLKRFMGDTSAFSYLAMQDAIADAQLPDEMVSNVRTGLIAGSGGASNEKPGARCRYFEKQRCKKSRSDYGPPNYVQYRKCLFIRSQSN